VKRLQLLKTTRHQGANVSSTEFTILGSGWIQVRIRDLPWDISLKLANVDGKPEIIGMELSPKTGARVDECVVSSAVLRRFPLDTVRKMAVATMSFDFKAATRSLRRVKREARARWPDEHYKQVAEVYRAARAARKAPTKAVGAHWKVGRAQASVYVKEARNRRYLAPPGKRITAPPKDGWEPNQPARGGQTARAKSKASPARSG
jgi:hypothetical protein